MGVRRLCCKITVGLVCLYRENEPTVGGASKLSQSEQVNDRFKTDAGRGIGCIEEPGNQVRSAGIKAHQLLEHRRRNQAAPALLMDT